MATWSDDMESLAEAIAENLSVDITFRTVTRGAMNLTTGKPADTTSDVTVPACRIRSRTYTTPDGKRRIEQTRWAISAAELGAVVPDSNAIVVYDGQSHAVVSVERSCDAKMLEVVTERSGV